jgi:acetyl esterase/lipase
MKTFEYAPGRALDLHLPDGPAAALCVYLHGGGWRVGSRTDELCTGFFERVASAGLAVATVDYRLSTEAVFPAQLDDVRAAVDFLAGRRDLPTRTVAWGVSAGGHLAALAALAAGSPVSAVVCWYPPTDFDALSKDIDEAGGHGDRGAGSREGQLIGAGIDERPDLAALAGPVNHVRPGAPPFLFLHGDRDLAVPLRQSERLASALTAAGGEATVETVPGAGHMFPELADDAKRALVDRSVRFLLR